MFTIYIALIYFLAAKNARLEEKNRADQERRVKLQTVLPDLLRNNMEVDNMESGTETGSGGPDEYLDLLLDEEEAFIREYRQRLINDGFW